MFSFNSFLGGAVTSESLGAEQQESLVTKSSMVSSSALLRWEVVSLMTLTLLGSGQMPFHISLWPK